MIEDQTLADQERLQQNFPKVFQQYRIVKTINHGSFSTVVLVEHIRTGQQFACKIVSRQILQEQNNIIHFEQEIRIHQSLKHENICQLYEIVYEEDFIFLIMEYCANGELFEHVAQSPRLSRPNIRKYFAQLCAAINYLHSRNVAHRDLKLENIYLTEEMNIRLGDFGFSHSTDNSSLLKTSCGSVFYASPELIRGDQYDGKKSDIWSMGICLYILATSDIPWTEKSQAKVYSQIERAEYNIPRYVDPEVSSIIQRCLNIEPEKRPTAAELMATPYVDDYFKNAQSMEEKNRNTTSFSVVRRRPLIVRPTPSNSCRASLNQTDSYILRVNEKHPRHERRTTHEAPIKENKLLANL